MVLHTAALGNNTPCLAACLSEGLPRLVSRKRGYEHSPAVSLSVPPSLSHTSGANTSHTHPRQLSSRPLLEGVTGSVCVTSVLRERRMGLEPGFTALSLWDLV